MTTKQTDPQAALAAALNQAQGAAGAVSKGSRNDYHRYRYASAEALIEEGRSALHGAGLALVPGRQAVDLGTGDGMAVLKRTYTLIHSGGGSLTMSQEWPIIPEKGRPMDKAVASAVTASLGYFLRDLLLMPRVDPADDLDSNTRDSQPRGRENRPTRRNSAPKRTKATKTEEPAHKLPGSWQGLGNALNLDEAGHDEHWERDRQKFFFRLGELRPAVSYSDLREFCIARGREKPSAIGSMGRKNLLEELRSGKIPELLEVSTTGTPTNLL